MVILDFFAHHLPFSKTGYLWNNVPLYLYGIASTLYLICWCGFWLLILWGFLLLVPVAIAVLVIAVVYSILRYMTYPIFYTLLIGFIYPDGTAISKINVCWSKYNKDCAVFWNKLLMEDNNG